MTISSLVLSGLGNLPWIQPPSPFADYSFIYCLLVPCKSVTSWGTPFTLFDSAPTLPHLSWNLVYRVLTEKFFYRSVYSGFNFVPRSVPEGPLHCLLRFRNFILTESGTILSFRSHWPSTTCFLSLHTPTSSADPGPTYSRSFGIILRT